MWGSQRGESQFYVSKYLKKTHHSVLRMGPDRSIQKQASGKTLGKLWRNVFAHLGLVLFASVIEGVQLELRWTDATVEEAYVETPDGTRHTPSWSSKRAFFGDLDAESAIDLVVRSDDAEHRFSWTTPARGKAVVDYEPNAAPGERFALTIDPRPAFSGDMEVVARKRPERALHVPIAMTSMDADDLELRSALDLRQAGDHVPNLDISLSGGAGGAPAEATIYLRGVGQVETGIFADPGVGIYIDGLYVARSQGAVLDLLDLERVEILRGPQGTLFGKNTTGGAIQLITRRAGQQTRGRVGATVGELDRFDAVAAIEGTLREGWVGSLSARSSQRDGYTRSLANDQTFNDDDRWIARGTLSWLADETTRVDFSGHVLQERETALDQTFLAALGSPLLGFYNQVLLDSGQQPLDSSFITGDLFTSFSDFPSFSRGDVVSGLLRIQRQWKETELLSITGYRQYEYRGSSDFDGSPVGFFAREYEQEQDQISQEFQLTGQALERRLRYSLGGLYFQENPVDVSLTHTFEGLFEGLEAAPGAIYAPPGQLPSSCGLIDPAPFCMGGAGNPNNLLFFFGDGILDDLDIETQSWALFGEGSWDVLDRLSLSLGFRGTFEDKEVDFFTSPNNAPDRSLQASESWDAFSPRLALSYRVADDVVLYASAAHGFKSGGFNAGRSLSRATLNPYDQETLWAFETGFKGTFGNRKLQLTGAAFYYDYQDIQFASFLLVDREVFFVIQNAAEGIIQGFELALEAHLAPGLTFSGALGHVDSEYENLRTQGGAPQDGVVPKTPEWTFNVGLQYAHDLGDRGSLLWRTDYGYKTEYFNDVANSPSIAQDDFGRLSARLLYVPPGAAWEVALFGTNLTDEVYLEHGFAAISAGQATGIAGRPREWGLSLTYHF